MPLECLRIGLDGTWNVNITKSHTRVRLGRKTETYPVWAAIEIGGIRF